MDIVDLSRYDETRLEAMLYSYRSLAREHLEGGHFGLAWFAKQMIVQITVELNARAQARQDALDLQLRFDDVAPGDAT